MFPSSNRVIRRHYKKVIPPRYHNVAPTAEAVPIEPPIIHDLKDGLGNRLEVVDSEENERRKELP
jgi:hypothetical protein